MAAKNKPVLSDQSVIATLRLIRARGIGPVTYHRLLARCGNDLEAALDMCEAVTGKTPTAESVALEEMELACKNNTALLTHQDADYPDRLKAIEDAPPILQVQGRVSTLDHPHIVAIVGARNASAHARRFARNLARDLGEEGVITASGFAAGIDTNAHQGALQTGTIAVLAGGLGKPYPKENITMMESMSVTGAIISECPYDEAPTAQHFPRRNRIVSGLSRAVIIVEAALRSGSLITARLAAEQGRDVLAVPGFPGDPRAAGPNSLLKDGAGLIETAQDVLDALQAPGRSQLTPHIPALAQDELILEQPPNPQKDVTNSDNNILSFLSNQPIAVDDLAGQCHISIHELQGIISEMELNGRIIRYPGNRIALNEE